MKPYDAESETRVEILRARLHALPAERLAARRRQRWLVLAAFSLGVAVSSCVLAYAYGSGWTS